MIPASFLSISSSFILPWRESRKYWTVFSGAEKNTQVPHTMQNLCGAPIGLKGKKKHVTKRQKKHVTTRLNPG